MEKKNTKLSINSEAVRQLAVILDETNLSEIEYEDNGCRVRVARQQMVTQAYMAPANTVSTGSVMDAAPSSGAYENQTHHPKHIHDHPGTIKSPMVGTAYLSPEPGAPAFVKPGDRVEVGQTVMIIEAMKVMNPIKAPKAGIVKEICVTDSKPIEFDEALLIIE